MQILKIVVKVLIACTALAIINGSMADSAPQLVGRQRHLYFLTTFGSVALLHLLIWQFIVGNSTIVGRDPKSFIELGRSKTFYSGTTAFGYIVLATHCLRLAGYPPFPPTASLVDGRSLIYGLTTGLTLIGIGMAARLRLLLQASVNSGAK
jgi:hypothetical protein